MRKSFLSFGFALVLLILAVSPAWPAGRFPCVVVRVIDGDSIVCRVGHHDEHVRLIGVDAPEAKDNEKHFKDIKRDRRHSPRELIQLGRESADFTARLLPAGTRVELEPDVEERDKYGRVLAYVWKGGIMVNAELIKAGMATVMTIPPNVKNAEYFYVLQKDARKRRAGFWR